MDIERESIFILISAGKYLRMYLFGVKKSSYHIIAYIQMGIGRASICLLKIWCTPQPKVWCTPQPKVSKIQNMSLLLENFVWNILII